MTLQLADSLVCYPAGIAEDIPIKIQDYFVPVDFVVLNMEITKELSLILRRPFLSTAVAQIDIGAREIRFIINGKEEKFEFRPRHQEQCSMIRIKYGLNSEGIREVEIHPQIIDNLSKIIKESKKKPEQKKKAAPKITKTTPTPPKKTKQVWRVKEKQASTSTSPGQGASSSQT